MDGVCRRRNSLVRRSLRNETRMFKAAPKGANRAKHLRRGVPALLLFCLMWPLASCHKASSDSATAQAGGGGSAAGGRGGHGGMQQGPIPVTVTQVKRTDLPLYVNGLGGVIAYNTVTVKSRVDGQLMSVNFREGQEVKKGDVLMQIDPRTYEAALAQAEGALAHDQALLADARVELERFQNLYQEGVYSKEQLDTQQSTFGQYEGAVKTDLANIETAKLNIQYARITSPIDGRVGLRQIDPGNLVQAASGTGLVIITQLKPIAVDFTLPEDYLPAVRNAMHSGKPLHAEAWSRDDLTKIADGQLLTLDNQIDITTGTDKLKAVFPNENEQLWPNQFVNVKLLLDVQKNVLTVPSAAIQRGPSSAFVYVVQPDDTVKQAQVVAGRSQGQLTEITSGLTEGETIVVDGQNKLIPGSKVQPRPMQKGTTAAAAALVATPTGGQPLLGVTPQQSSNTGSTAPVNPSAAQVNGTAGTPGQNNQSGNNRSRGHRGSNGGGSGGQVNNTGSQ